jgi:hypothetical protein
MSLTAALPSVCTTSLDQFTLPAGLRRRTGATSILLPQANGARGLLFHVAHRAAWPVTGESILMAGSQPIRILVGTFSGERAPPFVASPTGRLSLLPLSVRSTRCPPSSLRTMTFAVTSCRSKSNKLPETVVPIKTPITRAASVRIPQKLHGCPIVPRGTRR